MDEGRSPRSSWATQSWTALKRSLPLSDICGQCARRLGSRPSILSLPGISLSGYTVEITLTPQLGQGRPQPVSVRNRHPDSVGPAELESARTASVAVRSAASPPEGEQG